MSHDFYDDILGDDGEFKEPVDTDFGVYSAYPRRYWWRLSAASLSVLGIIAVVVMVWYF